MVLHSHPNAEWNSPVGAIDDLIFWKRRQRASGKLYDFVKSRFSRWYSMKNGLLSDHLKRKICYRYIFIAVVEVAFSDFRATVRITQYW